MKPKMLIYVVFNFIDFYENMYKMKRKSVYHRKYHIENVINEYTKN